MISEGVVDLRQFLHFVLFFSLFACSGQENEKSPRVEDLVVEISEGLGTKSVSFKTTVSTAMNLDVSPDGNRLVFDLLGDVYLVPIDGGEATRLVGGSSMDVHPVFSQDGDRVLFTSDRSGAYQIWEYDIEQASLRQITFEDQDMSFAGTPSLVRGTDSILVGRHFNNVIFVDTLRGTIREIEGTELAYEPLFDDLRNRILASKLVAFDQYQSTPLMRIFEFDILGEEWRELSLVAGSTVNPALSPDNRLLAYARSDPGEGFSPNELWVRDLESGVERRLASDLGYGPLVTYWAPEQGPFPRFGFHPNGEEIFYADATGRIRSVAIDNGLTREIPFSARVEFDLPNVQPPRVEVGRRNIPIKQLRWINRISDEEYVFGAIGSIWRVNTVSGEVTKAVSEPGRAYSPKVSPTADRIAYVTWSDETGGKLVVEDLDAGTYKTVIESGQFYSNPTWSADGSLLAFLTAEAQENGERIATNSTLMQVRVYDFDTDLISDWGEAKRFDAPSTRAMTPIYFSKDALSLEVFEPFRVSGAEIRSISLSAETETIVRFPFNFVEMATLSPERRYVFATNFFEAWVVDLTKVKSTAGSLFDVDLRAEHVERIPLGMLESIQWVSPSRVQMSSLNRLYEYDVGEGTIRLVEEINFEEPRRHPTGKTAITNAKIITMGPDGIIDGGFILIDGDRIEAIGAAEEVVLPASARVIDVQGGVVIPGLIDVHAHPHHFYGQREHFNDQRLDYLIHLAYGITTIFDPAAGNRDVFPLAEMIETGDILGPRVFGSGMIVHGGRFSDQENPTAVRSIDEANLFVTTLKASGAIQIKSYAQLTRLRRQLLLESARKLGVGVTAEGTFNDFNKLTFVFDGHTSIEHIDPQFPWGDDWIRFFASSDTNLTTTLLQYLDTSECLRLNPRSDPPVEDIRLVRFGTRGTRFLAHCYGYLISEPPAKIIRMAETITKIGNLGGAISLGNHGDLNGLGTHYEMQLLALGGMKNIDILVAATVRGAEKIGIQEDLGSIEVGKIADLLVLKSDPLEEISNAQDIRYVIKNGFVLDPSTLEPLYP